MNQIADWRFTASVAKYDRVRRTCAGLRQTICRPTPELLQVCSNRTRFC